MSDNCNEEKEYINKFSKERVLEISYEDYFSTNESIAGFNKKISNFLGINYQEVTSQQKKILPKKLKDIVSNYDEVYEILIGSKYSNFLF